MSTLTLSLAVVLFGALLMYAGWTNRSVRRLIVGDASAGTGGGGG